jgi:RNA polymerase sigma-70 factor (sigma-E family)
VCRVRERDEDEFSAFVRAHHARTFRVVYLLTGDYHQAEDIMQVTFLRLYQRWGRVSAMRDPAAYVRKVAVSQVWSWRRRRSSGEVAVLQLVDLDGPGSVDAVADQALWSAVLTLPARQRAVIVLRFYEDLSAAQTAEILGMAVGTVKSHCHTGCQRLSELLEEPSGSGMGGRAG